MRSQFKVKGEVALTMHYSEVVMVPVDEIVPTNFQHYDAEMIVVDDVLLAAETGYRRDNVLTYSHATVDLVDSNIESEEVIVLHDIEGMARLSGLDVNDCMYLQFEVDYLAGQEAGECAMCEAVLESGWTCLDGGEEFCEHHIILPGDVP